MGRKAMVVKPDTVLKNYWRDKEQFADLFNAVLFRGEEIIKAEDLEDVDTEESYVLEHREFAESIQAARDSIQVYKSFTDQGIRLVLLGMEDQEHIHYAMPLRVMGYDYGTYKKQYDSNAGKYRTAVGLDENEYLSRMKKTDRFFPVVTVVIYYGEKPWDGATDLWEMLDVPDAIKPFVNNYRMLLVEAGHNDLIFHNVNNINFFNMLKVILDQNISRREAKDRVIKYARERRVDRSVLMTFTGVADCRIDYDKLTEKGETKMYSVFEAERQEGFQEGLEQGVEALVNSLKSLLPDADAVYQAVIRNEVYMDLSREEVLRYYE